MNNTGRVALVTGSSRGIGAAIARDLASCGYDVCLNCSAEAGLNALSRTAQSLSGEYGVRVMAICANVAAEQDAKRLVDKVLQEFGRIDVLVNNAGITKDKPIVRMSEADFDDVVDVNLKGAFNCCKAVARPMMKQRGGRIINMSSVVGVSGNVGQANYAASKAGVIGLTKALAKELAGRGITANAIAPGYIATDMTDALSEEYRVAIEGRIALGRIGRPEDVTPLVRFLAGSEADYVTGQVICVDGGLVL